MAPWLKTWRAEKTIRTGAVISGDTGWPCRLALFLQQPTGIDAVVSQDVPEVHN
jgi:hypothetical protein